MFLLSNSYKIPHGGYWSVIIALFILSLILIYTSGQKKLYKLMKLMKSKDFLEKYRQVYATQNKIMGTALFFTRDIERIPQYISHVMFKNNIIYENNIFISIIKSDSPFGIEPRSQKNRQKG